MNFRISLIHTNVHSLIHKSKCLTGMYFAVFVQSNSNMMQTAPAVSAASVKAYLVGVWDYDVSVFRIVDIDGCAAVSLSGGE